MKVLLVQSPEVMRQPSLFGATFRIRRRKELKVYGLVDPRDGQIRYIGITLKSPRSRLRSHLHLGNSGSSAKKDWIRELRERDLKPDVTVLERREIIIPDSGTDHPPPEAKEIEKEWISKVEKRGCDLTNSNFSE
jgi:hypothetical protein